jgi:hypothetical protein
MPSDKAPPVNVNHFAFTNHSPESGFWMAHYPAAQRGQVLAQPNLFIGGVGDPAAV